MEADWVTVTINWKTTDGATKTDTLRGYISPGQIYSFTDEFPHVGTYTYTYVADPIQKEKTVTEYKTEQQCSTAYRMEQQCS